jgi:ADP-heptose:LPS heptosyltransferase
MHPNTIRKIDYWLGQPICFFLSLFRFNFLKGAIKPKKIIFFKFIEQGATVLAYNAIQRAIELVGKENVFFCVFESNRSILDVLNIIPSENIITLRDKTFLSFIKSSFAAILKIRRQKIDTAIDMEFFSRASAIFSFLTGAKIRVGLHRFTSELPYRGNLMTHRIQYNPYLHTSVFYSLLVEATGQNPNEVPMMKMPISNFNTSLTVFQPTLEEKDSMLKKLEGVFLSPFKIGANPLILLNPNASDLLPLRKWPKENFIELGKKIIAENDNSYIIITGTSSEQKEAEDICRQINSPRAVSFAGKTNFRELLTLYSLANVLVTNDSGPGHFSSLTTIRTIILFGPETPKLFGPLSPNAHIICKELSCSPCVNVFNHRFSPCNDNVCMKLITVDEVYVAVKSIINDGKE